MLPDGGLRRHSEVLVAEAARAGERGVLDVAAEVLRALAEVRPTPEAKLALGRALADAWAFEQAHGTLAALAADDPRDVAIAELQMK